MRVSRGFRAMDDVPNNIKHDLIRVLFPGTRLKDLVPWGARGSPVRVWEMLIEFKGRIAHPRKIPFMVVWKGVDYFLLLFKGQFPFNWFSYIDGRSF